MKEIDELMNASKTCVMATITPEGKPEAATVGFSHNEKYELLVGTSNQSRKYQNLLANPEVAIVVGFEKPLTVQYEGTARQVPADELEKRMEKHFEKVPGAKFYAYADDQVWFVLTPKWMRFTDIDAEPTIKVVEITEFGEAV